MITQAASTHCTALDQKATLTYALTQPVARAQHVVQADDLDFNLK
jgi:hypothetical protein